MQLAPVIITDNEIRQRMATDFSREDMRYVRQKLAGKVREVVVDNSAMLDQINELVIAHYSFSDDVPGASQSQFDFARERQDRRELEQLRRTVSIELRARHKRLQDFLGDYAEICMLPKGFERDRKATKLQRDAVAINEIVKGAAPDEEETTALNDCMEMVESSVKIYVQAFAPALHENSARRPKPVITGLLEEFDQLKTSRRNPRYRLEHGCHPEQQIVELIGRYFEEPCRAYYGGGLETDDNPLGKAERALSDAIREQQQVHCRTAGELLERAHQLRNAKDQLMGALTNMLHAVASDCKDAAQQCAPDGLSFAAALDQMVAKTIKQHHILKTMDGHGM